MQITDWVNEIIGVLIGGTIMWIINWIKSHPLDQKILDLKDEVKRLQDQNQIDNQKENLELEKKIFGLEKEMLKNISSHPTTYSRYDPDSATLYFGTQKGDFSIRLHDGETVSKDIGNWIHKVGLIAPLIKK